MPRLLQQWFILSFRNVQWQRELYISIATIAAVQQDSELIKSFHQVSQTWRHSVWDSWVCSPHKMLDLWDNPSSNAEEPAAPTSCQFHLISLCQLMKCVVYTSANSNFTYYMVGLKIVILQNDGSGSLTSAVFSIYEVFLAISHFSVWFLNDYACVPIVPTMV